MKIKGKIKISDFRKYTLLIVFIALCVFFSLSTDAFLKPSNIKDVSVPTPYPDF